MKTFITAFLLFFALFNGNAQEVNSEIQLLTERKNDIILDPLLLIAVPMINISYERILKQNMGVGINAMIDLSGETDEIAQISPYFRYYLGKKYASGFFLQGFAPITVSEFSAGLGLGFGGKWVLKKRLVLEVSGGVARRVFNDPGFDEVTGVFMTGIGYRF